MMPKPFRHNPLIIQRIALAWIVLILALAARSPRAGVNAQVISTPTRTPTPINVGNLVWDDVDHDGRQDAGEPGLAGITVQLWNGASTQLIDSTTTNSTGNYTMIAPTPGDYRVRVILPSGSDAFSPKDEASGQDTLDSDINPTGAAPGFTDIYTFGSNLISITSIDAGILVFRTPTPTRTPTPIHIGNFVWHDLNGNGVQDTGEPGVGGVTVQLWNADRTELIDTATTNGSGIYALTAPLPGDYRVRVLPPPGASFSPKDQGGDDTRDSDINTNFLLVTYGFTDIRTIASNVISITSIDIGLTQVVASPTPTLTPTPSQTPSPTPSQAPTSGLTLTPQPALDIDVYLPLLTR